MNATHQNLITILFDCLRDFLTIFVQEYFEYVSILKSFQQPSYLYKDIKLCYCSIKLMSCSEGIVFFHHKGFIQGLNFLKYLTSLDLIDSFQK